MHLKKWIFIMFQVHGTVWLYLSWFLALCRPVDISRIPILPLTVAYVCKNNILQRISFVTLNTSHTAILEGFLLRWSGRAGFVLFVNVKLSDKYVILRVTLTFWSGQRSERTCRTNKKRKKSHVAVYHIYSKATPVWHVMDTIWMP